MPDVAKAIALAKALVDRIAHDDSGSIVGGQFQGGNGGMLSRETLLAADALRRELEVLGAVQPDDAAAGRLMRDHANRLQL